MYITPVPVILMCITMEVKFWQKSKESPTTQSITSVHCLHSHILQTIPCNQNSVNEQTCNLTLHCPCANLIIILCIYRVSQEEWTKLRESVPYVKLYRYNPKHLYPKLNCYGDNGHRKVWASGVSTYCKPSVMPYSSTSHARQRETTSKHRNAVTLAR